VTKVLSPLKDKKGVFAAARAMRNNIAAPGSIGEQIPILSALIRCYDRVAGNSASDQQCSENFRPRMEGGAVLLLDDALSWTCRRYNTSVDEIVEVESMLDAIDDLPYLIGHPLLHRMLQVEYG
jgi:hypothetical protein